MASHSRVVYIYMSQVPGREIQDRKTIGKRLEKELPLFIQQCRAFWEYEIRGKGNTRDGDIPITRRSASIRRTIEYSTDRAIRDWMYTHISVDYQPYRQYVGKNFDDVFTIPTMVTYEEVRENVAKIVRKEKGDTDFIDRNTANLMDLIANKFDRPREQAPQKFYNNCGKYVEIRDAVMGLRISDDPVCDLDLGGLDIQEVMYDYCLYLGENVRIRQQVQQQEPEQNDVWGDFI